MSDCCDSECTPRRLIVQAPSKVPPWHRPVISPSKETLTEDGTISLNVQTTYLDQTTPKDAEDLTVPYEVVLEDGNYDQQTKDIQIPSPSVENTAVWRVTGNFVGFVALGFNDVCQSVGLKWDGSAWHYMSGNAQKLDS